jgi:hypothetical protein
MSTLIRWRVSQPLLPLLLVACIIMLMAVLTAMIFSRGSLMGDDGHVVSLDLMKGAYDKVEPGKTSEPELAALGFDRGRFKAHNLSGLGVQEYFMPRTSADFDRMDPAVRACFDTSDRCTALVFPLAAPHGGGFMAGNAAPRPGGRVVFLLKSGRVAYKAVQRG